MEGTTPEGRQHDHLDIREQAASGSEVRKKARGLCPLAFFLHAADADSSVSSAYPAARTVRTTSISPGPLMALRRRRMWTSTVRGSTWMSRPQTALSTSSREKTRFG